MDVKILWSGCSTCEQLETATRAAMTELGVEADVQKVTDPGEIASWGVLSSWASRSMLVRVWSTLAGT